MKDGRADFRERLNHIYQLTGFADPIYAEAAVTVHDYDIVLDVLVLNRTNQTLTNLTVEMSTIGDLKIVDRLCSTIIDCMLAAHQILSAQVLLSTNQRTQPFLI